MKLLCAILAAYIPAIAWSLTLDPRNSTHSWLEAVSQHEFKLHERNDDQIQLKPLTQGADSIDPQHIFGWALAMSPQAGDGEPTDSFLLDFDTGSPFP